MKKKHPIEALIEQGEHQQLDFKFEVSDSKKIARTLSAFANTDGGRLLIGVKDNGAISGVRSEEEYYMIEAASKMYTHPEVPYWRSISPQAMRNRIRHRIKTINTRPISGLRTRIY